MYSSVLILNLPRKHFNIFYQSIHVYIKSTSFACVVSIRTYMIGPLLCEYLYRAHFGKVLKSAIGNICFLYFRCFLLNFFHIAYSFNFEHNGFQIWTLTSYLYFEVTTIILLKLEKKKNLINIHIILSLK